MNRTFAQALTGLVAGSVFGLGLAVSQMANPEKVLAFLDVFGHWDPSLLFVMGAAVLVTFFGYRYVMPRQPLFETSHALPGKTRIDRRLIAGAILFGVGWGAAGYCPGPAITALSSGSLEPVFFVGAFVIGSQVARIIIR